MKKIFTLLFLGLGLAAFSTPNPYTYLQVSCAHQNPGGLNTDVEEPSGLGTTWTTIRDSSATPVWSPATSIPFTFNFNGGPVATYRVSTTGVLTFSTATAPIVPVAANVALPSALIPDSSVCIWGINGFGYYHPKIATKTFGTAPNRQHWIWFNTFGMPGTLTNSVTYWAIVLEETTNNIYIVDQRTFPSGLLSLTLGVQIDGSTATQVTGSPTIDAATTVLGGNYDGVTDNVYYEFTNTTLTHFDTKINTLPAFQGFPYLSRASAPFTLTGEMVNLGDSSLTGFTLNYSINGGATVSSPIVAAVTPGSCFTYSHPTAWNPTTDGVYKIKVWASNLVHSIAGGVHVDAVPANDTLTVSVCLYTNTPVTHKVVFEEATGTWCGWCPRGAVYMDSLKAVYPNSTVLIAVHNADPMTLTAYDAGVSAAVGGYPSVLVDRKYLADPSAAFSQYTQHLGDYGMADLDLTLNYDHTTRVCSVTVAAKVASSADTWNWRLGCVFTEDHVTGSGSATWDQHNYYSIAWNTSQGFTPPGALHGAGHTWENEPNPVPAANMEWNFVARSFDGYTGTSGSLPASLTAGSTYSHTFTYTVPATSTDWKMNANVLLFDATNNIILNGNSAPLSATGINEVREGQLKASIYPNPATNDITVAMNLEKSSHVLMNIVNVLGQTCMVKELGTVAAGDQKIPVNISKLAAGTYFVTITTDNGSVTTKFSK